MDSLTQAVLGAAVGETVLGKKVGNKAPLWGALAATLPDLDVVAYPFYDAVDRLGVHRGFSHSIHGRTDPRLARVTPGETVGASVDGIVFCIDRYASDS
jgi:hypothetical protein